MSNQLIKNKLNLLRRHKRVRASVKGTMKIPRLSVFRSSKHVFLQLIDDDSGKTLVSFSDKALANKEKLTKTQKASLAAKKLAELAKEKGIKKVVFDRGGYKYHGRVKAVADSARLFGLIF
jgi:large subunit ribosomal protein L18